MKKGEWAHGFKKAKAHKSLNIDEFQRQYQKNTEQWKTVFSWLRDTDLLTIPMPLFRGLGYGNTSFTFPRTVLKSFRVEAKGADGSWTPVFETSDNHQRFLRGAVGRECLGIRLVPLATWGSALKESDYGSSTAHLFAFEPI